MRAIKGFKLANVTLASALALALSGCGDDPLVDSPTTAPPGDGNDVVTLSGNAADGYLKGATVCLDLNANKACDSGEPMAVTTAGGAFTIPGVTQSQIDANPLLVEIKAGETIDEDFPNTALTKSYQLSAPAGYTFISPLTTLIQNVIETQGSSAAAAELAVKTLLGTDLDLGTDYIAGKTSDSNQAEFEKLHKVAQVSARVIANKMDEYKEQVAAGDFTIADLSSEIMAKVFAQLDDITSQVDTAIDAGGEFDLDGIVSDINDKVDIEVPVEQKQYVLISSTGVESQINGDTEVGEWSTGSVIDAESNFGGLNAWTVTKGPDSDNSWGTVLAFTGGFAGDFSEFNTLNIKMATSGGYDGYFIKIGSAGSESGDIALSINGDEAGWQSVEVDLSDYDLSSIEFISIFAVGGTAGVSKIYIADLALVGEVKKPVEKPVVDTEAPVISLIGAAELTLINGNPYNDQGANVSDNVDNNLVATVSGADFDTSINGVYTITYTATDAAGNEAEVVTRTVTVVDDNSVEVPIIGNGDFETDLGSEWVFELGGGTPTIIDGELVVVDLAPGEAAHEGRLVQKTEMVLLDGANYAIRFDARADEARDILVQLGHLLDASPWFTFFMQDISVSLSTQMQSFEFIVTVDNPEGLTADLIFAMGAGAATNITFDNISITEAVVDVDTEAPIITLIGGDVIEHIQGNVFVDPGVEITDNVDTDLVATVGGTGVDVDTLGSYLITYDVSDTAGNDAQQVTRTVDVVEPSERLPYYTFFNDMEDPKWALFGCCGNATSAIIADSDASYGNVAEFTVTGDTVTGFTARAADGAVDGVPFDASAVAATGTFEFDLKMTTPPTNGDTSWKLKVESVGGGNKEVSLPVAPTSDWTHYSVNLADLGGVDLAAIDLVMVFPAWGTGAGAVYSVDNVAIFGTPGDTPPPVENDAPGSIPANSQVMNGDFAMGTEFWGVDPNTTSVTDGILNIDLNGGESRIKQTQIGTGKFSPGQEVTLTYDIKGSSSDGAIFNGVVHSMDPAGVSDTFIIPTVIPTDTWQTVTHTFTVGNQLAWGLDLTMGPVCGAVAGCAMDVYLANVSISGDVVDIGEGGDGGLVGMPSGTIPADTVVMNGGFDNSTASWDGNFDVVDGIANINIDGGEGRIKQTQIGMGTVTPGQQLTVTFDIAGISGPGSIFNGVIHSMDPSGVSATFEIPTIVPTPTWQTVSHTFTAGSQLDWGLDLTIGPVCGAVAGCGMDVYIDNVSITAK